MIIRDSNNREIQYLHKNTHLKPCQLEKLMQEWEKAKANLTTAKNKQENIISEQFRKEYENVADFEQKHEIKLPEDIAALLIAP